MSKAKISITVDAAVLAKVDRVCEGRSRSDVVERALRRWLVEQRRQQLENEIEAYYADSSPEERREDRDWARASAHGLAERWK